MERIKVIITNDGKHVENIIVRQIYFLTLVWFQLSFLPHHVYNHYYKWFTFYSETSRINILNESKKQHKYLFWRECVLRKLVINIITCIFKVFLFFMKGV